MRFGAILDHLEATFIHFGPFEKVKKKSILTSFWPFFGHFGHPSHTGSVLAGGRSRRAENTARGESVLLAAARFRCLGERVGTTPHIPVFSSRTM